MSYIIVKKTKSHILGKNKSKGSFLILALNTKKENP